MKSKLILTSFSLIGTIGSILVYANVAAAQSLPRPRTPVTAPTIVPICQPCPKGKFCISVCKPVMTAKPIIKPTVTVKLVVVAPKTTPVRSAR